MRALAMLLGAGLCFVASFAGAQASPTTLSPPQALEAVRELTLHARFAEAVTAARELLARSDLTAAQRNGALEAMAVAQLANQDQNDAAQTLQLLYSRDPGHRLTDPDASPPVIGAFARARESQPETIPIRLEHTPPRLTRREAPSLTVRIPEGADAVSEVRLIYRAAGEGESRVVMTRREDGRYTARIPVVGDASSATDVAYHIVGLSPSLSPLAQVGSAAEPLQLRIPRQGGGVTVTAEAPPDVRTDNEPGSSSGDDGDGGVASEWWLWTIVALVVVGGAVTAGVVVGTSGQGPEAGSLGTVRLMQVAF